MMAELDTGEETGLETGEGRHTPPSSVQQPILSVCIPTCNRAALLGPLLNSIAIETAGLGEMIEIVVSDNGSVDETADICAATGLGARLRYFRHAEKLDAASSFSFLLEQARGKYFCHLADDGMLFWPALLRSLLLLEDNPQAVSLYAPWYLVDRVSDQIIRQFYQHSIVQNFTHDDRADLVRFVLEHKVFSETAIHKTHVLQRVKPLIDPTAFWGFTMPAELLGFGAVIYSPEPFYGCVTRHPDADDVDQFERDDVMESWDGYRGGVEHLIGLAGQVDASERAELRTLAEQLVQERMLVALRLRLARRRDAVGSYFLGSRLRGLGREADLPVPMNVLSLRAALGFLESRACSSPGAARLVLVGAFEEAEIGWIAEAVRLPVIAHAPGLALGATDVAMIAGTEAPQDCVADLVGAGFAATMADLLAKFP